MSNRPSGELFEKERVRVVPTALVRSKQMANNPIRAWNFLGWRIVQSIRPETEGCTTVMYGFSLVRVLRGTERDGEERALQLHCEYWSIPVKTIKDSKYPLKYLLTSWSCFLALVRWYNTTARHVAGHQFTSLMDQTNCLNKNSKGPVYYRYACGCIKGVSGFESGTGGYRRRRLNFFFKLKIDLNLFWRPVATRMLSR